MSRRKLSDARPHAHANAIQPTSFGWM